MSGKAINVFDLIKDFKALVTQGSALKRSDILVNTEATASALYGVVSALIRILNDLGMSVDVSWVDMHTMTNGWAITASFGYAVYRVITNAAAGLPAPADK
jgi:hypothetical protein